MESLRKRTRPVRKFEPVGCRKHLGDAESYAWRLVCDLWDKSSGVRRKYKTRTALKSDFVHIWDNGEVEWDDVGNPTYLETFRYVIYINTELAV